VIGSGYVPTVQARERMRLIRPKRRSLYDKYWWLIPPAVVIPFVIAGWAVNWPLFLAMALYVGVPMVIIALAVGGIVWASRK
jgi:hypothetical protein